MLDLALLAEEMAAIVDEAVERAVSPWVERVAALEARTTADTLSDAGKAALLADWQRHMDALPKAEVPAGLTADDLDPLVTAAVADAVAALPAPQPGKSVDPVEVEAMVQNAFAALPAPENGKSVTVDDVRPLIADAVNSAVAALPPAKPGEPADPEVTRQLVADAVANLPKPQDGKSVTAADVEPLIASLVERAVAALPKAKDGIGLAGAMIDRKGSLIMTLSDGTLTDLGRVEGENGNPGLGFDDLSFEYDGERAVTLKVARGEQVKTFGMIVPVMIDRGVYREGQTYERGDAVTFGGSLWIAQKATGEKPDGADTGWRLAVKKGRDAREPAKA